MGKLPGFMFYPADWQKDPNLKRCTKAEKGFWMDLLCVMFECEDRGVLSTDDVPWTDEEIAGAVLGDTSANLSMLSELLRKGVAYRSQSGAIFCKRMVEDEKLRKTRQKSGLLGGRPPSKKSKTISKTKAKTKQMPVNEYENTLLLFEGVWGRYPRKLGRDAALKSFRSALKDGATAEQFGAALDRYVADIREKRTGEEYILHGSTWFNGRWKDWLDYKPPSVGDDTAERKEKVKAVRRAVNLSECHGSQIWVDDDGKATCVSCHEPQPWFKVKEPV